MSALAKDDYSKEPEALFKDLEALAGSLCRKCQSPLCHHGNLISIVMGFKSEALCVDCLARGLDLPRGDFLRQVLSHIRRRDCFWQGWQLSNRSEYFSDDEIKPDCLWTSASLETSALPSLSPEQQHVRADQSWDAGDMSCGDLVLELRMKLKAMTPGQVLEVRATDPGAPQDIPAWCGLTGNTLLRVQTPTYWIQRKPF